MRITPVLLVLVFVFSAAHSHADAGKALVYFGKGSCEQEPQADGSIRNEQCSTMGMKIARMAGLTPVQVHPQDLNEQSTPEQIQQFFSGVKVWIQPGGNSVAYEVMNPVLVKSLRNFIQNGGGYVGWCAGAFMTGIGLDNQDSLRILPAETHFYHSPERDPRFALLQKDEQGTVYPVLTLEKITWQGQVRRIYFEGGPYLSVTPESKREVALDPNFGTLEVIARYPTGQIAAARTTYGKGRVFVSGVHPEAPAWWSNGDQMRDPDGVDHDLAADMVRWAAE